VRERLSGVAGGGSVIMLVLLLTGAGIVASGVGIVHAVGRRRPLWDEYGDRTAAVAAVCLVLALLLAVAGLLVGAS